ncbi:MAG: enoyl-CoA hydratase/isomerase family protein, partial [Anaerolineales bacterium]|nr:enoyl-CoA hydratase/isomerase family protein [Anaerolineales bacterium]
MLAYTTIITEVHERVGLVRLNRPKAMNALNNTLLEELMDALENFDADQNIGAIVITGNERAFAAGADIKEMVDATAVEMLTQDNISRFDRIRRIRKPVIAAVSGWAL